MRRAFTCQSSLALFATVKLLCSGHNSQQQQKAGPDLHKLSERDLKPLNCSQWLSVAYPGEVICQNNSMSLTCGVSHFLSTDQTTEAPIGIMETGGFWDMICVILHPEQI